MKLLFATTNKSKSKRFNKGLEKENIEIITLSDLNIDIDVEENGESATQNALIKARAYAKEVDLPVMAMDDTLYIENIPEEKQPGLNVRRINGKRLNDEEMIEYYTNLAKEYGNNGKLTAKWVYGLAIIKDNKEYTYTWNKEDFYIVDKPHNIIKEGYPLYTISVNKKLNKYFPEITEEEKLLIKEDERDVIEFISNTLKGI